MALLTSALDTDFTPAVGYFAVQVTGGAALLLRKNASGVSTFTRVEGDNPIAGSTDVYNAVSGAVYRLTCATPGQTVTIRVDQ